MWEYSIDKGWKEIGDLLQEVSSSASLEEQIKAAGFGPTPASTFGEQYTDFYAEVYGPRETSEGGTTHRFLIVIELQNIIEAIAIPGFPDLIEILSKVSSISNAAMLRTGSDDESEEE
jgi:hypothetical protein